MFHTETKVDNVLFYMQDSFTNETCCITCKFH